MIKDRHYADALALAVRDLLDMAPHYPKLSPQSIRIEGIRRTLAAWDGPPVGTKIRFDGHDGIVIEREPDGFPRRHAMVAWDDGCEDSTHPYDDLRGWNE